MRPHMKEPRTRADIQAADMAVEETMTNLDKSLVNC